MSLVHYTAKVRSGLLLELPTEAQELHLKPGDKIQIQLAYDDALYATVKSISSLTGNCAKAGGTPIQRWIGHPAFSQ